jgi:3-deoxy-D-manno-octulosonic-acid transferase
MSNCAGMAASLDRAGAALTVCDAESLADAVARLLRDPDERRARATAAARVASAGAAVLDKVLGRLAPFLDALAPAAQPAAPPVVRRIKQGSLQAATEHARP